MTNQPPKQDRKWWECSKFCDLEHEDYLYDIPAILAEHRKMVVGECLKQLPDLVECEPTGEDMPTDPALAADQAYNYAITRIKLRLSALLNTKDEV